MTLFRVSSEVVANVEAGSAEDAVTFMIDRLRAGSRSASPPLFGWYGPKAEPVGESHVYQAGEQQVQMSDPGPLEQFRAAAGAGMSASIAGALRVMASRYDVVDLHFREASATSSLVKSHGGVCYRVHVDVYEELELVPAHLAPVAPEATDV